MSLVIGDQIDVTDVKRIGDAVFAAQREALDRGQIPIIGALIRRERGDIGTLLALGSNRLADGMYGVHGEQGPFLTLGRRIGEDAARCVIFSSLHPCQFCQYQLFHTGIAAVHALDVRSWAPTDTHYERLGMELVTHSHPDVESTFSAWIRDERNRDGIWLEDVGIVPGDTAVPVAVDGALAARVSANALRLAEIGAAFGEAPIGAVLIDEHGEIISESRGRIVTDGESTLVPAMAAWRALPRIAGRPRSWRGVTIFLTAGPDAIVEGMVRGFNFGQVVVMSTRIYAGRSGSLRSHLGDRFVVLDDQRGDALLRDWIRAARGDYVLREYLGADYRSR